MEEFVLSQIFVDVNQDGQDTTAQQVSKINCFMHTYVHMHMQLCFRKLTIYPV